jgi:uncharacterized protein
VTCRSAELATALGLLAAALVPAAPAQAASTRCAGIRNFAERMLCADLRTAEYDKDLHRILGMAMGAIHTPELMSTWQTGQQTWEVQVRDACRTLDCIYKAYDARLDQVNEAAHEDGLVN